MLVFRDSDSEGSDCWDNDSEGEIAGIVIQRERLLVFRDSESGGSDCSYSLRTLAGRMFYGVFVCLVS